MTRSIFAAAAQALGSLRAFAPSPEKRWTLRNPPDWLRTPVASSGETVNDHTAVRFAAAYSCVRVIGETIGSVPIGVIENQGRNRRRAREHYLWPILHDEPNDEKTAAVFWEQVGADLALRGNHYSRIVGASAGRAEALIRLDPVHTKGRRREDGVLVYETLNARGIEETLRPDEVFHLPLFEGDGINGLSPVAAAAQTLGIGLAADRYAGTFYQNGTLVSGAIEHPQELGEDAAKRLRASWENLHRGARNAHRVAILEEGAKFQAIGMNLKEAQFIETRTYSVRDVARIWRVPLHMINDLEGAKYNNVEHLAIDFVKYTMSPYLRRIEQEINRKLFTVADRGRYASKFNLTALLRGDSESRNTAYLKGREGGWYSVDDIRALEDLNPVEEGGDLYHRPANWVPLDDPGPNAAAEGSSTPSSTRSIRAHRIERRDLELRRRISRSFFPLFENTADRFLAIEFRMIERAVRRYLEGPTIDPGAFVRFLEGWYREHEDRIREISGPTFRAFASEITAAAADEVGAELGESSDLEAFVDGYVDTFALRSSKTSLGQLRALADDPEIPNELLGEEVLQRSREWAGEEEGSIPRREKIARRETNQGRGAFSKAAWLAVGIGGMVWVTRGKNCPSCNDLDGRYIPMTGSFAGEGDRPGGILVRTKITHPPLHDGCDCDVIGR